MNAGETKGAPQQSVVNGWYANDIAVVQAAQNSYIAGSSMRNGNLLALIGLGVAGEFIIRGVERAKRPRPAMSQPGNRMVSLLIVDVASMPYGHNNHE